MNDDNVKQAFALITAGDKQAGQRLLVQAIKENPQNEKAWFLLSAVVDEPQRKKQCLQKVLQINPGHEKARQRLASLQNTRASKESAQPPTTSGVVSPGTKLETQDDGMAERLQPLAKHTTKQIASTGKSAIDINRQRKKGQECPHCGYVNSFTRKNCKNCHNRLEAGDSDEFTKPCPYCGETIKQSAILCRYCGSNLGSQGSSHSPTSSHPDLTQVASIRQQGSSSTIKDVGKTTAGVALGILSAPILLLLVLLGLVAVCCLATLSLGSPGSGGTSSQPESTRTLPPTYTPVQQNSTNTDNSFTTEASDYLAKTNEVGEGWGIGIYSLNALIEELNNDPSMWYNQDWIEANTLALALIEQSNKDLRAMNSSEIPASYRASHSELLDAASEYDIVIRNYNEWLVTNHDSYLEQSTAALNRASAHIDASADLLP